MITTQHGFRSPRLPSAAHLPILSPNAKENTKIFNYFNLLSSYFLKIIMTRYGECASYKRKISNYPLKLKSFRPKIRNCAFVLPICSLVILISCRSQPLISQKQSTTTIQKFSREDTTSLQGILKYNEVTKQIELQEVVITAKNPKAKASAYVKNNQLYVDVVNYQDSIVVEKKDSTIFVKEANKKNESKNIPFSSILGISFIIIIFFIAQKRR